MFGFLRVTLVTKHSRKFHIVYLSSLVVFEPDSLGRESSTVTMKLKSRLSNTGVRYWFYRSKLCRNDALSRNRILVIMLWFPSDIKSNVRINRFRSEYKAKQLVLASQTCQGYWISDRFQEVRFIYISTDKHIFKILSTLFSIKKPFVGLSNRVDPTRRCMISFNPVC